METSSILPVSQAHSTARPYVKSSEIPGCFLNCNLYYCRASKHFVRFLWSQYFIVVIKFSLILTCIFLSNYTYQNTYFRGTFLACGYCSVAFLSVIPWILLLLLARYRSYILNFSWPLSIPSELLIQCQELIHNSNFQLPPCTCLFIFSEASLGFLPVFSTGCFQCKISWVLWHTWEATINILYLLR